MGQAVADLPNPLDAPPPANIAGTDDLLSQLAGDEIDRLLSEAEDGTPGENLISNNTSVAEATPPVEPVAAPAPVPTASVPETAPVVSEEKPQTVDAPSAPAISPDAATPTTATTSLTDQVPAVLAQFGGAVTPSDATDSVMSAAERDALGLSQLAEETAAAELQDAAAAAAAKEAPAPAPAAEVIEPPAAPAEVPKAVEPIIRVLEAINSPLSFIPDSIRDALGKVAIVTIVNSVAVLVYVLFFRR
jgi:hypothetical protein